MRFCQARERIIRYRVVDEYDGDTLSGASEMTSGSPLTLSELTDFFLNAWTLADVVERNMSFTANRNSTQSSTAFVVSG